jgi:MYXO-CTERM domain-containing protein
MTPLRTRSVLAFALPALLAVVGSAGVARADALPPDACAVETLGQACTNAGPNADEDGTCQMSTCSQLNYSCDGGTGGPCGSTTTSCTLCLTGSGSGSGSGTGSSGSSSGSAACSQLALCCSTLPSSSAGACAAVFTAGDATTCQAELASLAAAGYCSEQAGSSSTRSSGGGSKTNASGSGPVTTPTGDAGSDLAGAAKTDSPASSSGCSATPSTSLATDGLLFFGLGAALLLASRRRRQNR